MRPPSLAAAVSPGHPVAGRDRRWLWLVDSAQPAGVGDVQPAPPSGATASASPASPTPNTATPPPPRTDACVSATLASLSEAQRIGQLFMVGLRKDRVDQALRNAVTTSHFGSVAFTTQTAVGVNGVRDDRG